MSEKPLSITERIKRLRSAAIKSGLNRSPKGLVDGMPTDEENQSFRRAQGKAAWDKWGDAPLWDDRRGQP